jgi:membrane protease YdiL (CAAX protease family)
VKRRFIFGVFAALSLEFLLRDVLLPANADGLQVGLVLIAEWLALFALIALWIPKVESLGTASVGWTKPTWSHVRLGVLAYLLATVVMAISGVILPMVGLEPIRSLQPRLIALGWPVLLGLCVTGTLLEEVLYRGYLIERVTALTGRAWLAGLVSWSAFTLVHLRFLGVGPTIDISILSAALVLLYLKERSLWPCIVLHGLNNVLAYVVFPLLTR